jgi:Beta-lactamase superfamily domain
MPLKISRVLHAGYIFEDHSTRIVFDPILTNPFSRNCYAFPEVEFDRSEVVQQTFSALFISHFHEDHCCFESLNLLNKKTPLFIYCVHQELIDMLGELGFKGVHALKLNEPVKIGSLTVTPLKALDPDVDAIFHIQYQDAHQDLNILNVVDAWIDLDTLNELKKINRWDLILWPFQTLREIEVLSPAQFPASDSQLPEEWLEQIKLLNPQIIVPSSCQFIHEKWSWYNQSLFPISYADFETQIQRLLPETRVLQMNPGTSYQLDSKSIIELAPLPWIKMISKSMQDYFYNRKLIPPPTSEVSKKFPALSENERKKVDDYCERGLIKKFNSLEETNDIYFKKNIFWKLTIYDHQGFSKHFNYIINRKNITLSQTPLEQIHWLTEVPSYKLHAALYSGESLTSMYLRINDPFFSPAHALPKGSDVDLLQDPLIRCLFTNEFGHYHKEQLKRVEHECAGKSGN